MHRSRHRLLFAAAILAAVMSGGHAVGAETSAVFRAGAAAVDITPREFPVRIAGSFLEGTATEARDRLHARCLVLDDGRIRVVIAVIDNCLIPRDLFDEAKELAHKATGVPVERMLMSATHSHSAPAVVSVLGTDVDESYRRFLPGQIAKAVQAAVENLAPARIGWTIIRDPVHTHCRRWIRRPDRLGLDPWGRETVRAMMHPGYQNPDYLGPSGPSDPDISIVSVQSREGRPVALLANYSMHYVGATPVSADYFGAFATKVGERFGGGGGGASFVGIMSNGTAADQQFMDYSRPRQEQDMHSVADAVAGEVVDACKAIRYRDRVSLAMAERTLSLGVRPIREEDLDRAKEAFAKVGERKPKAFAEVYPREQVLLSRMPSTRELKLQALRIGDLGVVAVPCEVFALTGLKIKAQSPLTPTFTIELANGYDGYIPPPEQHALGGYTTWRARSACLEVQAEPKIVSSLLRLLEEVAGKPCRTVTGADHPFSAYPQSVLASKPLAYWRLNESAGPQASDATGNGNDGVFEGGVAFYLEGPTPAGDVDTGKVNRAPQLAGGRIAATIAALGDRYTLEMWFSNYLPIDARSITGCLFFRPAGGADAAAGDCLSIGGVQTGAGTLLFHNGGKADPALVGRTVIRLNDWNHVAMLREGSRITVYLNGGSEPEFSGQLTVKSPSDSGQVFLGGCGDPAAGFEGRIDEVALYDRVLAPAEVIAHYAAAAGEGDHGP